MTNIQYFKKLIADIDRLLPESNEWHFILNDRLQIVTASRALQERVRKGVAYKPTCDLNLFELVHPADHELLLDQLNRVLSREIIQSELNVNFGCDDNQQICNLRIKYVEGSGSQSIMGTIFPVNHHAVKHPESENVQFADQSLIDIDEKKQNSDFYEALSCAIENNELHLKFQPLYDTHEKKICGAEVLIRWNNAQYGDVPPSVFIPIAEQSDLINKIGDWVLDESLKEINQLKDILDKSFAFSINVSPVQITSSRFQFDLEEKVLRSGIDFQRIQIELTENVFVKDFATSYRRLEYLKRLGLKVAMDDFGTGYSSLNYIRRLPLDVIKIDKQFTSQIVQNDIDKAIAKAIVDLAKSISIDVIAEGIETEDQMHQLMKIGCRKIQGYYIAKPLTVKELKELLMIENSWKEIVDIR